MTTAREAILEADRRARMRLGAQRPETDLMALAHELLDEHDQNKAKATEAMLEQARDDGDIAEALMRKGAERVFDLVVISGAKREDPVKKPVAPVVPLSTDLLSAWAGEVQAGLLETFALPDGTPLRDAKREALVGAAETYRREGRKFLSQAKWMELLAQSIQPGQSVGSRITESRAVELLAEAAKENADAGKD